MPMTPIDIAVPEPRTARPFQARGTRFDVRAAAEDVTDIELYDEISWWGVTAKDFRARLAGVKTSRIRLAINSPGGDVYDGIAIYNDLLAHPAEVEVVVTGLAASAASVIAMAGDRITMAANAFLMIHNSWGITVGNRSDHIETADLLGMIDGAMAKTYAARSGQDVDKMASLMAAETWLDAEGALALGLADRITGEGEAAQAAFDLSRFTNVPGALRQSADSDHTLRDAERALRDAGFSRAEARRLLGSGAGSSGNDQWDAGPELEQLVADAHALATRVENSITRKANA
ncbi:MAG: head maturation protease, ClpP-related [Pseudomonadota bacterium]|nr:head maturation protease, ClpP-related [Pseudomonadota bacterium]